MVGPDGLEPSTPRLSSACSNQLSYEPRAGKWHLSGVENSGGAGEVRTRDPLLAKQVLYQLSYDPSVEGCRERTIFEIYFVRSTETRTTRPILAYITFVLRPSDTVIIDRSL
jgi:hypothetical protein